MLIVEGPDLVGKSTLVKALVKQWNDNAKLYGPWPVISHHLSKLPETWHHYKSYLPYINRTSVWDRFHLSELVYGRICRGETNSRITPGYLRLLEARPALVGSVTIVVTMNPDRINAEWKRQKREQFAGTQQLDNYLVQNLNAAYLKLVRGEEEAWTESRIDFHYHVEGKDGGWPSDKEGWMYEVLQLWSSRLGTLYSLDLNGEGFYGKPNKECE